jgi:two-component system LytT family response regulator
MRVVVVDDEAPARARLVRLLAAAGGVEIVGEAQNGLEALDQIVQLAPDLVFLDIDLPELGGLEIAAALPEPKPAIVFLTAWGEHAVRAFELSATDYLVKPVTPARLAAALERARTRVPAKTAPAARRLAVRSGARFVVFDPARVYAVRAREPYTELLLADGDLLADDSLDALLGKLASTDFVRVHRSAAINLTYLSELVREGEREYAAVLTDAARTRIPVSRHRLGELKQRLGLA